MGWARVALMSRCGSGAAAATTTKPQPELPPHHKRSEPFRAIMHPLLWHAQPAHAARTASTFPSPHSLALSRSSVSGASHLHLQRRSSSSSIGEKKREFLSFIRRFPRNPHSPPHLLHFSFYICTYIFVVSKKKRFFFVKLTQQLANWTHYSGQLERQRKNWDRDKREGVSGDGGRDGTVCNGYTNFQPTQFFALISFLFLRLPRDTAARGGNKNFFFRFSLQQEEQRQEQQQPFAPVLHLCPFLLQVCLCCACAPECFFRIFNLKCECAWGWENTTRLWGCPAKKRKK